MRRIACTEATPGTGCCSDSKLALELVAALWDLAPLKVIVEEAGGRFTDFRRTSTAAGPTAISSNGLLHAQVQELVQG